MASTHVGGVNSNFFPAPLKKSSSRADPQFFKWVIILFSTVSNSVRTLCKVFIRTQSCGTPTAVSPFAGACEFLLCEFNDFSFFLNMPNFDSIAHLVNVGIVGRNFFRDPQPDFALVT
uniref:Uncharacterized protein n=1 Tax=Opuntia streptacantha TaxID=393608 RepID=A0A7C9CJC4_OPUST